MKKLLEVVALSIIHGIMWSLLGMSFKMPMWLILSLSLVSWYFIYGVFFSENVQEKE